VRPILVVEDDLQFREVLRSLLEDEGWPAEFAADGRQALAWIARQQPALLILDWVLPDLDGQVVAAGLRTTHGEEVPILLMTADGRAAEKARQVGAFAFLHKPFDLAELTQLVRGGLAGL